MEVTKSWRGRRVLVTGVSGFIGKAVAQGLTEHGAEVTGIISDLNRNLDADFLGTINVVLGDVADIDVVRGAVSAYEVDAVFHLAANAIVRVAAQDPLTTYRTNVMGTANVLEAVRQVRPRCKVVVASSDKAYGDHELLPYTEDHALQPRNTYDTSKACADLVAQTYFHTYGMDVAVTRCSNVYGPGDLNMSRLVPNSIRLALEGKPPALYSDVAEMEREFIYIDDVVAAYLFLGLLDLPLRSPVFNVGGTGALSIIHVARRICELAGRPDLEPVITHRDKGFKEIRRQYIDARKLMGFGWRPEVGLDEGLKRAIDWYRGFLCV